MTGWPAQPVIYEINTMIWLAELSLRHGRRVQQPTGRHLERV